MSSPDDAVAATTFFQLLHIAPQKDKSTSGCKKTLWADCSLRRKRQLIKH
jgi:hypothetical protein